MLLYDIVWLCICWLSLFMCYISVIVDNTLIGYIVDIITWMCVCGTQNCVIWIQYVMLLLGPYTHGVRSCYWWRGMVRAGRRAGSVVRRDVYEGRRALP